MDARELFRLCCFVALILDTIYEVVDGILFERYLNRKEEQKNEYSKEM